MFGCRFKTDASKIRKEVIDAYRHEDIKGRLTPEVVEWDVKQYSSHWRIDKLLKIEEKLERADDDESSVEEEASEVQEHMDDP